MIPVTWQPEASDKGEPARILTRLMAVTTVGRWGEIALRAQHLARVRAASQGRASAVVSMADLIGGVLVAADEFLPELAESEELT